MRRFTLGSGVDRKIVTVEHEGPCMTVVEFMTDGEVRRSRQELTNSDEARDASDRMVRELVALGFVERIPRGSRSAGKETRRETVPTRTSNEGVRPPNETASPDKQTVSRRAKAEVDVSKVERASLFDDISVSTDDERVLPRMAVVPSPPAEPARRKKKKPVGKKKKADGGDGLDKRVIFGFGGFVAVFVFGIAFIVYDYFLKPPTIVGSWSGAMLEHEISKSLTYIQYELLLDANRRASMTLQHKYTTTGTYSVKGDRLRLSLLPDSKNKDADEDEPEFKREPEDTEYRIVLGRVTLDLLDPKTGKLVVQLRRSFNEPAAVQKPVSVPAAPTNLGEPDPANDAELASVDFTSNDSAFRLRYPKGWKLETGARPDNIYSWARFTKGSATIDVTADIQGSLMSGSDSNRQPQEEGSEFAPVHVAHERGKRIAAEAFNDYKESPPTVFKGSRLGEGRISQFSASTGALFGTRVRGFRVTLLTNDRRITIMSQCPEKEFGKSRPTFLAVGRSLSR